MANTKGRGPQHPLDPKVVRRLLDLLSSDDGFRELFQRDAHAALVEAGWIPPQDAEQDADMAEVSGGTCLQLTSGATLASKEQIRGARAKLESTLNQIQNLTCPIELQA
jgi:putative modified peptide